MDKPFYLSKTIQGQAIALLGMLVTWFKLPIESDEISMGVGAIFALAGLVYSVYGRIKTKGEAIGGFKRK